MTTRGRALIGIAGICAGLVHVRAQTPVFRADADAVAVNVAVTKGNVPVAGLTAADFRLSDNGVAQAVGAVSQDAVPVDATIVLGLQSFEDFAAALDAVRGMTALLRPADRVRVLTFANSVANAVPWQSPGAVDVSRIQGPGTITPIADAVLVGLFHRTPPDRRHLVVVLADSPDWCSVVTPEELRRGGERSGAVLHWLTVRFRVKMPVGVMTKPESTLLPWPAGMFSYCRWSDRSLELAPALTDVARSTGGTVRPLVFNAGKAAVDAFDQIFDDFRRSYILHYVPHGVEPGGWHRLRVETTTRGHTIRARPGYWGTGPPI